MEEYTGNTKKNMQKLDTTSTDCYPSVFHKELQNNYNILPHSPTAISMEWYPSIFHSELQKKYSILPHSPTACARPYFTESCKKIIATGHQRDYRWHHRRMA